MKGGGNGDNNGNVEGRKVIFSYCPNCPKIWRVLKLVSTLVDKSFTICVSKKLLKGNLVKVSLVSFFLGYKNYTILGNLANNIIRQMRAHHCDALWCLSLQSPSVLTIGSTYWCSTLSFWTCPRSHQGAWGAAPVRERSKAAQFHHSVWCEGHVSNSLKECMDLLKLLLLAELRVKMSMFFLFHY